MLVATISSIFFWNSSILLLNDSRAEALLSPVSDEVNPANNSCESA